MPQSSVEPVLLKFIPTPPPAPLPPLVAGLPYLSLDPLSLYMHLRGQGMSLSFVPVIYSPPPAHSLSCLSGPRSLRTQHPMTSTGPCKTGESSLRPEVRERLSCVELQQVQGIRTAIDAQPCILKSYPGIAGVKLASNLHIPAPVAYRRPKIPAAQSSRIAPRRA